MSSCVGQGGPGAWGVPGPGVRLGAGPFCKLNRNCLGRGVLGNVGWVSSARRSSIEVRMAARSCGDARYRLGPSAQLLLVSIHSAQMKIRRISRQRAICLMMFRRVASVAVSLHKHAKTASLSVKINKRVWGGMRGSQVAKAARMAYASISTMHGGSGRDGDRHWLATRDGTLANHHSRHWFAGPMQTAPMPHGSPGSCMPSA